MFKTKLEQYRRQIRRQQLQQIFRKKRKQLFSVPKPTKSTELETIQRLNQQIHKTVGDNKMVGEKFVMDMDDLLTITKFSQTQLGVQCLLKTDIPVLVLPFLTSSYYNRPQQRLAACIFTNITYMKTEKLPSHQFLRNIINIIENTLTQGQQQSSNNYMNNFKDHKISTQQLLDTIDNCLLIIYHLMVDFTQVIRFYVQDCGIVNILSGILQSQVSLPCIEKVLKILTFVNQYFLQKVNKKPVRKFLKFYLTILQNSNEFRFIFLSLSNIQSLMSIYCQSIQSQQSQSNTNKSLSFTQIQKQFSDMQSQIQNSHFLLRINAIYKHITKKKLMARQLLNIFRMLIPGLTTKTIQQKVFGLMNLIIDEIYTEKQVMVENQKDQNSESMEMKLQFYQVIYQILCILASYHQAFTKNILYTKICQKYQDFESTHSSASYDEISLRKAFIYIFGMLTFSGIIKHQQQNLLRISIDKYKHCKEIDFDGEDLQDNGFQAFVDTVEINLNQLSVDQF